MVKYKCEKCGTVSVRPSSDRGFSPAMVFICSKEDCQHRVGFCGSFGSYKLEPVKRFVCVVTDKVSPNVGFLHSAYHYEGIPFIFTSDQAAKQTAEKFFVTMCERGYDKNRFDLRVVELENPA